MIAYAHKSSMLPSCSIAVRLFVRSVGMSYTPCVTKRCAASGCETRSHVAKLVAKAEPHHTGHRQMIIDSARSRRAANRSPWPVTTIWSRSRRIAAAPMAYLANSAFAQGCDLAFLTTADPVARRAYEHAGFQPPGDAPTVVTSVAPMQARSRVTPARGPLKACDEEVCSRSPTPIASPRAHIPAMYPCTVLESTTRR